MSKITIPKGTTYLMISGDYLDELIIPSGIAACACPNLGLRKIVAPDGLQQLFCNRNCLRELVLPESLYALDASHNPLYHLTFRGEHPHINLLRLQSVKLKTLDVKIRDTCEIDIRNNPHLVNMSKEVRYACLHNLCYGDEFDVQKEMGFYYNRPF